MPLAPEYAAMFAQLAEQEPAPPLWEMTPEQGREMYRAMRPLIPELPVHQVEDRSIEGSLGDIPVRIYTPAGDGPFGVLMNFHGGGWVIGDLDTADAVCRQICAAANVVVVSVDYRMAPEAPYPAATTDAYDATAWAAATHGRVERQRQPRRHRGKRRRGNLVRRGLAHGPRPGRARHRLSMPALPGDGLRFFARVLSGERRGATAGDPDNEVVLGYLLSR